MNKENSLSKAASKKNRSPDSLSELIDDVRDTSANKPRKQIHVYIDANTYNGFKKKLLDEDKKMSPTIVEWIKEYIDRV